MGAGDQYRIKAAEFHARAQSEVSPHIRVEFENLAKASCVKPSKPTGMSALRRSTTYAGKFGRVPNTKEFPTNHPAQDRRFRPNEIA
jgi:hypothetical protein